MDRILERIALPLLLFTAVLFILLFVSWFGILPRFTRFAVADVTLSPTQMAAYVAQEKATLATLEQKRNRLVLPSSDLSYDTLRLEKRSTTDALTVRTRLLDAASHIIDAPTAVAIDHLSIDTDTNTVSFSGDVRGVGPRSMTVLATFVDTLEALPFVSDLTRPSFTRIDDAMGIHSPFTMSFTLTSAQ